MFDEEMKKFIFKCLIAFGFGLIFLLVVWQIYDGFIYEQPRVPGVY